MANNDPHDRIVFPIQKLVLRSYNVSCFYISVQAQEGAFLVIFDDN